MCPVLWGCALLRGCSVLWGISWVPWGVQYHGGITMHVGDILSTVGVFSTMGISWYMSLHIYHGTPTVLNIPHGTQDIPHMYHDILHCTEHPPWYCTHVIQGDKMKWSSSVQPCQCVSKQKIILVTRDIFAWLVFNNHCPGRNLYYPPWKWLKTPSGRKSVVSGA